MFAKLFKFITPLLYCTFIFSCNNNQSLKAIATIDTIQRKNKETQTIPFKDTSYLSLYPILITPDTNNCIFFKKNRFLVTLLKDEKATVELRVSTPYLRTSNYNLWVCNLPKEITKVGDTILISAFVYNIGGKENTVGYPSIITKIGIRKPTVGH